MPAVVESSLLAVPGIGTVVNLDDESECTYALSDLRQLESLIREAKGVLTEAVTLRSQLLGSKTIHLEGGRQAVVSGGPETVYDADELEAELREAGMPEQRIREIVIETTSYKVAAAEAKRAAGANPVYAEILERHKRVVEKPTYISLKGFS